MTEPAEQATERKREFRYVKIDETKHWNEKFVHELGPGAKLIATYVYDAAEETFCAELTPSYCLFHAGTEIQPGRELTGSEWEHYDEVVREGEAEHENFHYRHCRSVKDSHPVPTTVDEDTTIDDIIEDFQANPW